MLDGHHSWPNTLAFSPDGRFLASTALDGEVKLWDIENRRELITLESQKTQIWALAFTPDGKTLAGGGKEGIIRLWDATTGLLLAELTGHEARLTSLSFSRDGRSLLSGDIEGKARRWETAFGRKVTTYLHPKEVSGVVISPDGQVLASASGFKIKLWDPETGQERVVCEGHERGISSLAISPDSSLLASAGYASDFDKVSLGKPLPGEAKVWAVVTGKEQRTIRLTSGNIYGVAFAPDGGTLAVACGDRGTAKTDRGPGSANLFDALTRVDKPFEAIRFEGKPWGEIQLWDVEPWKKRASLTHNAPVTAIAFAPDGRTLASTAPGGPIILWDLMRGVISDRLQGASEGENRLAFSRDGVWLAAAGSDHKLRVWDRSGGQPLRVLWESKEKIAALAFAPVGRSLAAADSGGTVKVWDAETGRETANLSGHGQSVNDLCFTADGRTLVTGSSDRTVRLWTLPGRE